MALACGVMVANIYLCQPLLAAVATAFHVPAETAALVAVATQIGYMLGILFVVPLADIADPVKLMTRLMVLTACALLVAAMAPNIAVLVAASLMIAATTVIAQILLPIASTLAGPEYRGRIVSALSTGLILGILLSRTFSGLTAETAGSWRAPYILQAIVVLLLRFVLPGFLPAKPAHSHSTGYLGLLKSLLPLLRYAELRLSMALSFFVFAAFSMVWATLAFHLASPVFNLGPAAAGLFGVWGAPGALMAPMAGRLSDKIGASRVNIISIAALVCSFSLLSTFGAASFAALVIAINFLDFGTQCGQVANQARIFGLGPEIRGRLNTLYMVTTFTGGATGALLGGIAWSHGGWHSVCLAGAALVAVAGVILAAAFFASSRRV